MSMRNISYLRPDNTRKNIVLEESLAPAPSYKDSP
jgi:hypothetical protein